MPSTFFFFLGEFYYIVHQNLKQIFCVYFVVERWRRCGHAGADGREFDTQFESVVW